MRKVIAAINMTIDGYCDHTAIEPDEEIHDYFKGLLNQGGVILYGRVTYQLMEFWRDLLENPSEDQSMNDFAKAIDEIPKVVFSRTIAEPDWKSATLATRELKDEIEALKQQDGKDIFIGSRSLINQLMNIRMIDEYWLCIHPVVAGSGTPLFDRNNQRMLLDLQRIKTFRGGAFVVSYNAGNR